VFDWMLKKMNTSRRCRARIARKYSQETRTPSLAAEWVKLSINVCYDEPVPGSFLNQASDLPSKTATPDALAVSGPMD
jgi:hypothetical protein